MFTEKVVRKVADPQADASRNLEADVLEGNETIEEIWNFLLKLEELKVSIVNVASLPSIFSKRLNFDLGRITQSIMEGDADLNAIAEGLKKVTAQDWKTVQEIFEEKKLPFSHDFVMRCQQVALKAMAA